MDNKHIFTKILALAGTILAWLPVAAPILFSGARLGRGGMFHIDYLMPAELFPLVLAGGGLLLWAALRLPDPKGFPVQSSTSQADEPGSPGDKAARKTFGSPDNPNAPGGVPAAEDSDGSSEWPARKTSRVSQRLIIWSLGAAVLLLTLIMVLPEVTGLADGRIEPTGWQWALVLGMLVGYILAVIALGVGGALLLRDLFKTRLPKSP